MRYLWIGAFVLGSFPVALISAPDSRDSINVYELFDVDEPPEPIKHVQPEYPKEALEKGLEGRVLVEAVIDENGNVIDARIEYSDNEIFNEAALAAMRKMKFKPAKLRGIPVKVRIIQPFIFSLKDRKKGGEK